MDYIIISAGGNRSQVCDAQTLEGARLALKLQGTAKATVVGTAADFTRSHCSCRTCTYRAAVVEAWPRNADWVQHMRVMMNGYE